jgi:Zn-dependent protease
VRTTVSFGRIAGIPVGAHWSALLGVVVLGVLLAVTVLPTAAPGLAPPVYVIAAALAALALMLSLLAHELAHALVARRSAAGVRRITLWLLGGFSELVEQPKRPGAEIRIAVVGPLVSLGLAGLFGLAAWGSAGFGAPVLVSVVLSWLAAVNLMIGVFNLLPGTPLDGGRVLHGVMWLSIGDRERATRAAASAGQVLGALLAGLGIFLVLTGRWDGLWLALVGWFITGTAAMERAHGVIVGRLEGLTAGDAMTREPAVAADWWTVQALVDRMLGPDAPRHRVLPVVDFSGRPVGVLRLADLAAVPPGERLTTTVRRVARPIPQEFVLEAATPVAQALERIPVHGVALVAGVDGRLAGVITGTDLERTVELQALRGGSHSGARPGQPAGSA